MYIGSTGLNGLHHLVWEVVDNSVDEAMAGHATRIDVTLLPDGGCRVVDDGRGIPVDPHPQYRSKSAAEVVLTVLHAGGKFGGGGYKVSGGLHGVGVSVVNALSSRLDARDRPRRQAPRAWSSSTAASPRASSRSSARRPAAAPAPPSRSGPTRRSSIRGHRVPGPDASSSACRSMAFLNKGLEIRFERRAARPRAGADVYKYTGGIVDFVRHLNHVQGGAVQAGRPTSRRREDDQEVEVALQWNTGYYEGIHSFANGIATIEGGMHEEGFKKALTNVVNSYARAKNLLKEKDDNLLGEDIREGLTAIITRAAARAAVRGPDQGQARQRLRCARWSSGPPTRSSASGSRSTPPRPARSSARRIAGGARPRRGPPGPRRSPAASRRSRAPACPASSPTARRRDPRESRAVHRRGRLAPAARPSRPATPRTQAILPIRGKILNVERARLDKMLKNTEIQALIAAIGAGVGEEFDVAKIRYHKVIILADADVDGSHIRTLLLTFFFRQMKPLVEPGYVYIAQPPLYSTDGGQGEDLPQGRRAPRRASSPSTPDHKHEFQPAQGPGRDGLRRAAGDHHGRRPAHAAAGLGRAGRPGRRGRSRSSWATTSSCASTSSRRTPKTCASSTSRR